MPASNIPSDVRNAVHAADRSQVSSALQGLLSHVQTSNEWLPTAHPLSSDAFKKLAAASGSEVADYLAATSPLHLMDGWRYLALGFGAFLAGDEPAAIHLGYYAELRATKSLLASESIGIFNSAHVSIDSNQTSHKFAGRTHDVAWQALRAWGAAPGSAARLLDSLEVEGHPLSEWLIAVGGGSPLAYSSIAERWVRSWGLDIALLADDHKSRDRASYDPSGFRIVAPAASPRVLEAIDGLWDVNRPGHTAGSAALDYDLLYLALDAAHGGFDYQQLRPLLLSARGRFGSPLLSGAVDQWLANRQPAQLPWIVEMARMTGSQHRDNALPVLARAGLMLRLASSFVRRMFIDAGVGLTEITPWLASLCAQRGFVGQGQTFAPPASALIEEVDRARDDLEASGWPLGYAASTRETLERVRYPLTQLDRAATWMVEV